jgi:hypothetical protein
VILFFCDFIFVLESNIWIIKVLGLLRILVFMAQTGPKIDQRYALQEMAQTWPSNRQNNSKWPKIALMALNDPKWPKWPLLAPKWHNLVPK